MVTTTKSIQTTDPAPATPQPTTDPEIISNETDTEPLPAASPADEPPRPIEGIFGSNTAFSHLSDDDLRNCPINPGRDSVWPEF